MTAEAIANEMSSIVREAAGPRFLGETIERQIDRASRYLGLPFRRARAYWYDEVRSVPAHEADALRIKRKQIFQAEHARLNAELEILELKIKKFEGQS